MFCGLSSGAKGVTFPLPFIFCCQGKNIHKKSIKNIPVSQFLIILNFLGVLTNFTVKSELFFSSLDKLL
jgi:hypothetical protein